LSGERFVKVKARLAKNPALSMRFKSAIKELQALHKLLGCDDVDPRVLVDFRDALNRVRNGMGGATIRGHKLFDQAPTSMASLLASERVRAACQLCRSIREDLEGEEIQFQKGQLTELYGVATQLTEQLRKEVR
jgi:hypothetical protein